MSVVSTYLKKNRSKHLEELKEILRIPSVSTDPAHKADILEAAKWIEARLGAAGCTRAEIHETGGHPIVYGEWLGAPGAPTILVYGHYDVQPVDPIELWNTGPFEPTERAGKLYARGAADDKGQVLIHVNALEAHLQSNGTCPVNVKFLIEGEEEIGSEHLAPFIKKNRKLLACDAVVVSDTSMFDKKTPSLCTGLRGLCYLQIELTGTKRDLHSGCFGGAVVNPANAMADLISALKGKNGKIKVPGFYDDVVKLTRAERNSLASLPHSDEKYRREIGAPALFGEKGYTTLERVGARPSLDVNGIWSGFTGEGAKTVIPAVAHAKISMRLVPNQSPSKIARLVTDHIKAIAPESVKVKVKNLHGGDAWMASLDHPAIRAAGRAVERAFGKAPVFNREGGSIPIVATFSRVLAAPCILMGIGLPDDALHAPNEKIDLSQFYKGRDAAAYLMEEIARG